MDLTNFSDSFLMAPYPILLSLVFTKAGSLWIDKLYQQKDGTGLLSFSDQIADRAKYRKALLFLLLLFSIRKAWISIHGPALLYIIIAIAFLSFITVTDWEQYVIFDCMLLPFSLIGLCYTLHMQQSITEHLAAGLSGGLLFLLLTLLTKGAIGGGDIKLIVILGLWLGVRPLANVVIYGFLAGGIAAFFLLITKQKSRNDFFAYGPYFALSGIGIMLRWVNYLF